MRPRHVMIQTDLACTACGYNLRGLERSGHCPECATSITMATRGALLKYGDPAWVKQVRCGLSLSLWNIPCRGAALLWAVAPPAAIAVSLAAAVTTLGGAVLLTTREPHKVAWRRPTPWRMVILAAACLETAAGGALLIPAFGAHGPPLAWVCAAAFVLGLIARLQYLQRFAHRIPDADLVPSTAVLLWVVGVTLLCLAPMVMLPALHVIDRTVLSPINVMWGIGIAAALLWAVLALARFRSGFRRAERETPLVAVALALDDAAEPTADDPLHS